MKTTSFHLWMCITQIIEQLNSGSYHSKRNWMRTFYVTPFPSLCTQEGPQTIAHAASWFAELLSIWNQNLTPQAPDGLEKISPFPLFGLPSTCIFIIHLCYGFASINRNGCKVNMLGTQGLSPWMKLPTWKWSWLGEHSLQWILLHPQHEVCLTVRELWVLWTSLRSSTAPAANHRDYLSPGHPRGRTRNATWLEAVSLQKRQILKMVSSLLH